MTTWTRERSHLGLLRAFLPRRGAAVIGADAAQAATVPGQNQWEVYGLAVFLFVFQACWMVEAAGSLWLGLPLSFVLIHVMAVLGAIIGSRLPTQSTQAFVWPQRLQWFFVGALAWVAIKQPFAVTQWLAWPLLILLISQLFLWPSEPTRVGVVLFVGAQLLAIALCLLLPADWRWGLPMIASMHAVLAYGAFHPQSEIFAPLVRTFCTNEKAVWLTIDDGPSKDTEAILELLDKHKAKATFFVIGKHAEADPDLVKRMAERGHEVANHTHSHPAGSFWMAPGTRILQEIERTQNTLECLTCSRPRCFRSPVGFKSPMLYPVLQQLQLPAIGWSARGFDGVATEVEPALERLCANLKAGDIILLHEGREHSLPLLRALLHRLDSEGFRCVRPNLFENEATGLS